MTADPRLVAIRRRAIEAMTPPAHLALLRRVEQTHTADNMLRGSRIVEEVAAPALPAVETAQVLAPGGSDFSDLEAYLAALEAAGTTYAPNDATYIVQQASGALTSEQALGSLATGILKNTTTTGVLVIAVANTDYLPAASPTATGTITLGGADGDISIARGHFRHRSAAPSIAVGAALGTGGSVAATISGSDQAGTINLTAGTSSLGTGTAATITFATARASANYAIVLTPRSATAGANAVGYYAVANGTTTWDIRFATAPTSGNTLNYFYVVVEFAN
jgi:hypothetical protein